MANLGNAWQIPRSAEPRGPRHAASHWGDCARHGHHHFQQQSVSRRGWTPGNRVFMSDTNDRTLLMKTTGLGQWTEVAFQSRPEDYL